MTSINQHSNIEYENTYIRFHPQGSLYRSLKPKENKITNEKIKNILEGIRNPPIINKIENKVPD